MHSDTVQNGGVLFCGCVRKVSHEADELFYAEDEPFQNPESELHGLVFRCLRLQLVDNVESSKLDADDDGDHEGSNSHCARMETQGAPHAETEHNLADFLLIRLRVLHCKVPVRDGTRNGAVLDRQEPLHSP